MIEPQIFPFFGGLLAAGLAVASYLFVGRPARGAPARSPLSGLHRRSLAKCLAFGLVAVTTFNLAMAFADRDAALAQPVGPGWSPDAGIPGLAAAGARGTVCALITGVLLFVCLIFDAWGMRRVNAGADASVARVASARGLQPGAAPHAKLFRRALVIGVLGLVLSALLFLEDLGAALAQILN